MVVILQYRSTQKLHVQVYFNNASQFYVHINVELYIHAFIHLYGGEKTGMLKFFKVPVVRDIGEDFTSQIISVENYSSQSRHRV